MPNRAPVMPTRIRVSFQTAAKPSPFIITAAFLNKTTKDHDKTSLQYDYAKIGKVLDSILMRNGESWEK
uniref:hypothetical protein n=1 Tax=Pedobacter sp. ASV28 TaxID=2795123 RepID=UPI001E5E725B